MKVIITPHHNLYKNYLLENDLTKRNTRFINNANKLRGLEIKKEDVVKLYEWYTIDGIEEQLEVRLKD